MGMWGSYWKFTGNFVKIAAQLTSLMNKKVRFEWTEECQTAFEVLKGKMIEAPIPLKTNLTKSFELHTDASNHNIGALFMQVQEHD